MNTSKIFLNWHLSRFTWVNVARTSTTANLVKNLVDECIEVQNLRLVCLEWSEKIFGWFMGNWNIEPGWKNLPSVKSFPVYDFRSLSKEHHTRLTIVREFLFSWFGSAASQEIKSAGEFCFFQSRPELCYDKGRYDSYSTDKLFVNINQALGMTTMSFEYLAYGHPNTRGELSNEYDVYIEDELCTVKGEGARCWTKNPRAHEKLDLGDFLRMTNYPVNEMYKTDDENVCVKMEDYENPFSFEKELVLRYDPSHIYKYHIKAALLTLLCISKYSEDSWISELPNEIISLIAKFVRRIYPFQETYYWRNGEVSNYKYRNVENDPWRRLLHQL